MNEVAIGINYIEFNVQDMMRSKQLLPATRMAIY